MLIITNKTEIDVFAFERDVSIESISKEEVLRMIGDAKFAKAIFSDKDSASLMQSVFPKLNEIKTVIKKDAQLPQPSIFDTIIVIKVDRLGRPKFKLIELLNN